MTRKGAKVEGPWRYWLYRLWDDTLPVLPYVMLNPSTADHELDDQTIRKCSHFATRDGYGGLVVVNLFAYRATKPKDLPVDPFRLVGPKNREYISYALELARYHTTPIVAAWGATKVPALAEAVNRFVADAAGVQIVCFGHNKDGSPKHPCYLANDTEMTLWTVQSS